MKTLSVWAVVPVLSLLVLLSGCSRNSPTALDTQAPLPAPWVRTVAIDSASAPPLVLSGVVRAQHETPIAFQLGGRVLSRHVAAGQTVRAGQLLFALDPRDVAASEQSAVAQLAAAEATVVTAERELERQKQLVAQGFVSPQTLDRLQLNLRNTQSQLDAARAGATLARNHKGYTELRSPRDGVVVEVTAEAGQVVTAGLSLATLAHAGGREVEVFLPRPHPTPTAGMAQAPGKANQPVTLREVAGAADPQSRTWRARYRLPEAAASEQWPLGAVVRLALEAPDAAATAHTQRVPLAALDERAQGARLWRVVNGQAEPVPVTVVALGSTHAQILSPLAAGDRIVALGTHRLTPGMAVRELAP